MDLTTTDALTRLALGKILNRKELAAARAEIGSGVHSVDVTIRVTGTLDVAEDTEKAATVKVLSKATVGLLLRRMGVTRAKAMELLVEVFTEAMTLDKDASEALLEEVGVDDAVKMFRTDVVDRLPKLKCKGAVRPTLAVEVIAEKAQLALAI